MIVAETTLERLAQSAPYGLAQVEKRKILTERVRELGRFHYENCLEYRHVIDRMFGGARALEFEDLEESPFLPVSLFKKKQLRSVAESKVVKVLTSSGTTGSAVSRIYLDSETAQLQSRVLVKIMQHFLGLDRRPMVIIDQPGVVQARKSYSARGAGVVGMLPFARNPIYALRKDLTPDLELLSAYVQEHREQVVFFGFTFLVWQFVNSLKAANIQLSMPGGILLHSGGWKKLENVAVSPEQFRNTVQETLGIQQVVNYYGMVEQVGSVFFENGRGHLQASVYSDVVVRDPNTLEAVPAGQQGLLQVFSALPMSYPGQSILTEDLGMLRGEDDPDSGMGGRYFDVIGRLPKADLRGCSDTMRGV